MNVDGLRGVILGEAHNFPYSIHSRFTKMYRDWKEVYLWNLMKKDISRFVAEFPYRQQEEVEDQRPSGQAQDIEIPTQKWKDVNMDFVTSLARTKKQHKSIG